MRNALAISGSIQHDGDGVISPTITVVADRFNAEARVWCGIDKIGRLADLLLGFPSDVASRAQFQLGGPPPGSCDLDFFCFDGSGHAAVRAVMTAADKFRSTDYFNRAEICIRVEANAVAVFVEELRAFHSGAVNRAVLNGVPEYFGV